MPLDGAGALLPYASVEDTVMLLPATAANVVSVCVVDGEMLSELGDAALVTWNETLAGLKVIDPSAVEAVVVIVSGPVL
jgi:hypothetical protein